jgi:NAD(P)-dependent dehydrogenase (short-subunit alcohol dehydrogenase family)
MDQVVSFLAASGVDAIANLGSVLGLVGDPTLADYGVIKGGSIGPTESLAIGYGSRGSRPS